MVQLRVMGSPGLTLGSWVLMNSMLAEAVLVQERADMVASMATVASLFEVRRCIVCVCCL